MCGIIGYSGRHDPALLDRMNSSIAHRGPDDNGQWFSEEDRVGLAHQRLSIIDVSPRGHQPMWDVSGRALLVFNGEIYNHAELRAELEAHGYRFQSRTDSEVLLNLFLAEGDSMLGRLNGMFAFAIWDSQEKSILLARDGIGVKPLYYAETTDSVLFGSELKSLLQDERLDRSIDTIALRHYLTYLWCPAPRTPLLSVKKVLPGEAFRIKDGRINKKWNFYSLPLGAPDQRPDLNQTIAQLDASLESAVARQMIADVPVGAFLSGGLDSSAVVAYAQRHRQEPLECFTIAFEGKGFREEGFAEDLPYAQEVAKHVGVNLNVVYSDASIATELEEMIFHLDEPQADFAPLFVQTIAARARDKGIKVLLSGAGGDDIFSGYRRHRALALERYWSWLPLSIRKQVTRASGIVPPSRGWGRRISKAFRYAELNPNERLASYYRWIGPDVVDSLFIDGEVSNGPETDPLAESLRINRSTAHPLEQMLYLDSRYFLPDHNLNYTDKLSMAEGVEVRVPLLDPDLIALASTIPPGWKQHGAEGKWIFKKTMERHLPRSVIYRPKTGFGVPLRSWLRAELRPMMHDLLSSDTIERRGIFSAAAVHQLIGDDLDGRIDASYTLLSLMCIELWCQIFLDTRKQDSLL